jgi:hypothetical protein
MNHLLLLCHYNMDETFYIHVISVMLVILYNNFSSYLLHMILLIIQIRYFVYSALLINIQMFTRDFDQTYLSILKREKVLFQFDKVYNILMQYQLTLNKIYLDSKHFLHNYLSFYLIMNEEMNQQDIHERHVVKDHQIQLILQVLHFF